MTTTTDGPTSHPSAAILRYAHGLPVYRAGQAPAHLATRNQLRRDGRSEAGLRPVARLHHSAKHGICELYDSRQARPIRPLTAAQRAVLAAGRPHRTLWTAHPERAGSGSFPMGRSASTLNSTAKALSHSCLGLSRRRWRMCG